MRQAFIRALVEAARTDKRIFLLTGDLGYRFLEPFRDAYPDRFLNVGVAEANLVTVAAGLATTGYIPVVYSIATFMTMRPYEQIRNDIALQGLNVKLVGVGGGLAYSLAGPTHHSLEDVALMRTLGTMAIVAPGSPAEAYGATKALLAYDGGAYLRLERNPESPPDAPADFTLGKARYVARGKRVALVFTGTKQSFTERVADLLRAKNINPTIAAFPTIHPLDQRTVLALGRDHELLVTIEEHRTSGGFGSAVLETLTESPRGSGTAVLRTGITGHAAHSAGYHQLCRSAGFTPETIGKRILSFLK